MCDLLDHFRHDSVIVSNQTSHIEIRASPVLERPPIQVKRTWTKTTRLGSGSYGEVWLESSPRGDTHDLRAVKIISKHRMIDLGIDYERELFALAKFSKSIYQRENALVEFLGWHENHDNIYILMEYFEYGDLSKFIGQSISEDSTRKIANDILRGLRIIHKENFVHRDLKPQNILVVRKSPQFAWAVKIGDFGASKRVQKGTEIQTRVGTAIYSAPEVSGCCDLNETTSTYDRAVDMWSLGCILYEILVQSVLFPNLLSILQFCENNSSFSDRDLSHFMSLGAIEFLKSLVVANPKNRLTAESALRSEWILQNDQSHLLDKENLTPERQNRKILEAASNGDYEMLQAILKTGANIDSTDDHGWTASNIASFRGHSEILWLLIHYGASLKILNDEGRGPWSSAAMKGRADIIQLLVDEGFSCDVIDRDYLTPLAKAISLDYNDIAVILLRAEANPYLPSAHCSLNIAILQKHHHMLRLLLRQETKIRPSSECLTNALILVSGLEDFDTLQRLFEEGADINMSNKDSVTPLFAAVYCRKYWMVRRLLANGADANSDVALRRSPVERGLPLCLVQTRNLIAFEDDICFNVERGILTASWIDRARLDVTDGRYSPLHIAVSFNSVKITEMLIKHGAKISFTDPEGNTPLLIAAQNGFYEILEVLLDANAAITARDHDGWTALHKAAHYGYVACVQLLLSRGATPQDLTFHDWSVLDCAAATGQFRVVQLLLQRAETQPTSSTALALQYAASNGHSDVVQLLLDNGAEPLPPQRYNGLYLAAQRGHLEAVSILLGHGANVHTANNKGWTLLHIAASQDNHEIVKVLLQ